MNKIKIIKITYNDRKGGLNVTFASSQEDAEKKVKEITRLGGRHVSAVFTLPTAPAEPLPAWDQSDGASELEEDPESEDGPIAHHSDHSQP